MVNPPRLTPEQLENWIETFERSQDRAQQAIASADVDSERYSELLSYVSMVRANHLMAMALLALTKLQQQNIERARKCDELVTLCVEAQYDTLKDLVLCTRSCYQRQIDAVAALLRDEED